MRIKFFTTGGMIEKVFFDARVSSKRAPAAEEVNEANATFKYDIESVLRKDSLEMTRQTEEELFRGIHRIQPALKWTLLP